MLLNSSTKIENFIIIDFMASITIKLTGLTNLFSLEDTNNAIHNGIASMLKEKGVTNMSFVSNGEIIIDGVYYTYYARNFNNDGNPCTCV